MRLRVKDLDFDRGELIVRKGQKGVRRAISSREVDIPGR
jgi:hypothetical protein